MESDDEKVCMFCLERKKGRREHLPIEFKGLFVCHCIFQSHAECIIKWQIHCGEEDIQCPICRTKIVIPRGETRIVPYVEPDGQYLAIKKAIRFLFFYILSVLLFVVFLAFMGHH